MGFFHKINQADFFVILDDVQFRKNYFHNRNRILINGKPEWITVPIKSQKLKTNINKVLISDSNNHEWKTKIINKVNLAYKKSQYYSKYIDKFKRILIDSTNNLSELNISYILWMMKELDINTEIIMSSSISVNGTGSEKIFNLCKHMNADTYLSGISGKDYLDTEKFLNNNIKISYQEFYHPIYNQGSNEFIPQISSIESLFLMGNNAKNLIDDKWDYKINKLFK